MRVGLLFKSTDKMSLDEVNKIKMDWEKKIKTIQKFQRKYEDMGRDDCFLYKKNQNWINVAQKDLDRLNQVIKIKEMQLP